MARTYTLHSSSLAPHWRPNLYPEDHEINFGTGLPALYDYAFSFYKYAVLKKMFKNMSLLAVSVFTQPLKPWIYRSHEIYIFISQYASYQIGRVVIEVKNV